MVDMRRRDVRRADSAQAVSRASAGGLLSRRLRAGVLALGLSAGLAFTSAAPASAARSIGTDFLRNWATGLCLDSSDGGESGRGFVYTNPCTQGNDYQTWSVEFQGHDTYDQVKIRNKATGLCLSRTFGLSTLSCGDPNTEWDGVGSDWSRVELRAPGAGQCLDSDSNGSAYVLGCNGGGNQKWKLGY